MAEATVRTATPYDVPVIAALHRDTWRAAYAELLPTDLLEQATGSEAERAWAHAVESSAVVLLAHEGDAAVGFCVAAGAPADDVAAADGTVPDDAATTALVSTLLVQPRWGRRGHGGRLLAEAATRLRGAGATRGVAWVPARDSSSLHFYRRAGWDPDGTVRTLDAGGQPLREVRLTGPLDLSVS